MSVAWPESFDPAFQLLQRFFAEEGFATPAEHIRQNLEAFLRDERYAVFLAYGEAEAVGIATVSTATSIELGGWRKLTIYTFCLKPATWAYRQKPD